MRISAIVVAGGRGTRLGSPAAKAFVGLGGTPLVVYSLRTLARVPELTSIVLVVSGDQLAPAEAMLAAQGPWPVAIDLTRGGAERQDSVAAGLARVADASDLVIVHDAARPFVSLECVTACVHAATTAGAAIAALPARDTIKVAGADSTVTQTLDRRNIWLAQTPQVFRVELLRSAHATARRDGYVATDDAALVERIGAPVRIVPGEARNRKITTPDDLRWAEWLLQSEAGAAAERA